MSDVYYRKLYNKTNLNQIKDCKNLDDVPLFCITNEFNCKNNQLSIFKKDDEHTEEEVLTALLFINENPHNNAYIMFSPEKLKDCGLTKIEKTDCTSGYIKANEMHYDIQELTAKEIEPLLKLYSSSDVGKISKSLGDRLILLAYKGHNNLSYLDLDNVSKSVFLIRLMIALNKDNNVFSENERIIEFEKLNEIYLSIFTTKKDDIISNKNQNIETIGNFAIKKE